MVESADVEEIEFFSDSGARKAKLIAFSPWKKMCSIVRRSSGDGLLLLCSMQKFQFLHCAICERTSTTNDCFRHAKFSLL